MRSLSFPLLFPQHVIRKIIALLVADCYNYHYNDTNVTLCIITRKDYKCNEDVKYDRKRCVDSALI